MRLIKEKIYCPFKLLKINFIKLVKKGSFLFKISLLRTVFVKSQSLDKRLRFRDSWVGGSFMYEEGLTKSFP